MKFHLLSVLLVIFTVAETVKRLLTKAIEFLFPFMTPWMILVTININKSQSIRLDWGKRKDRRTWKTGFITELLFTSLAVVMTDVSPMRTKETDLLTA